MKLAEIVYYCRETFMLRFFYWFIVPFLFQVQNWAGTHFKQALMEGVIIFFIDFIIETGEENWGKLN